MVSPRCDEGFEICRWLSCAEEASDGRCMSPAKYSVTCANIHSVLACIGHPAWLHIPARLASSFLFPSIYTPPLLYIYSYTASFPICLFVKLVILLTLLLKFNILNLKSSLPKHSSFQAGLLKPPEKVSTIQGGRQPDRPISHSHFHLRGDRRPFRHDTLSPAVPCIIKHWAGPHVRRNGLAEER
jgi:hypothetical protein